MAEDISKTNQRLLESIGQTSDYYLQDLWNNAYRIANAYNTLQIERNLNSASPMQRLEYINSTKENLIALQNNNPLVDNLFIMFSGKDTIISQDGAQNIDTEYNVYYSSIFKSREEWQKTIFAVGGSDYLYITAEDGQSYLYFVYVKNNNAMKATVAFVAEISVKHFDSIFDKPSANNSVLVIHRQSGAIVNSEEQMPNEQDYIILRHVSDTHDFEYIMPILKKDYNHRLNIVKAAFIISYILCLVIVGSLALVYARINYKVMTRMEDKIKNKNALIKNDTLCRILNGAHDAKLLNSADMKEYGIELNDRYYELAIFDVFGDDKTDVSGIYDDISVRLNGLVGDNAHIEYARTNDMLVAIIGRTDELTTREENDRTLGGICEGVKRDYGCGLYCAVSATAENIDALVTEYKQTVEIFNFINESDERRVYRREDISHEFYNYEFTHDMETKLITLIEKKKFDEAYKYVCEMVDYNVNHLHIDPIMIRVLVSVIVNTLIKSVQTIAVSGEPDYKKLCNSVAEQTDGAGIARILQIIGEFIGELDSLCEIEMNDVKQDKRLNDVMAYIGENFVQSELNVASIAYHFGLTPNYMSRWFSEKVGRTLLDYILSMRIQKAKELLVETDLLVDEIGRMVGFSSAMVFIKAFKRYESMTPAKYRAENK